MGYHNIPYSLLLPSEPYEMTAEDYLDQRASCIRADAIAFAREATETINADQVADLVAARDAINEVLSRQVRS